MLRPYLFLASFLLLGFSYSLAASPPIDHQLRQFEILDLDPATFLSEAQAGASTLILDGRPVELDLEEYSLCPGGMPVFHNDNGLLLEVPTSLPTTFRGTVQGHAQSHLNLTVSRDLCWVRGYVAFDDHWYIIQPRTEDTPASGKSELVVYESGDVLENELTTGPDVDGGVFETKTQNDGGGMNRGNLYLYPVVDTQFININSSNWLDRMWAQIGNAASLYLNRNIVAFVVEDYGTFTTSNETMAHLLLGDLMEKYSRNHDRRQHIVHLLTGRVLDGGIGGVGFQSVLGRYKGYSLSRAINGFSDYTQMILTCHELGHNFGGLHEQAEQGSHWNILCGWVGYTIMSPNVIQGCMLDYFSGSNTGDMLDHLGILTWAYPGTVNFQINNGNPFTNDLGVSCTAHCSSFYQDDYRYGAFVLSNGPAVNLRVNPFFSDELAEPHQLTSGDGEKEVFFYAYDANEYDLTTSATIILDTMAPSAVSGLFSPTHTVGEISDTYQVEMNWETATDLTAGIDGYSILWSTDSLAEPDETLDLQEGALAATSPELGPGSWYFSIKAVDNSGLWGAVQSMGPITLVTTSAVGEDGQGVPTRVSLLENYPDPFNPRTTIKFNLPKECHISLAVFNMRGQLVEELVNRTWAAGRHEVDWDGHQYPSGIYFYRMKTDGFSETRKMIMLK